MTLVYEGKAKKVYATESAGEYEVEFKDDATAFNGEKKGQIADKGTVNAKISAKLFGLLEEAGIRTHFISVVDPRRLRVRALKMLALEVVVRNRVAGSLAKRTGLPEGEAVSPPVIEFYYKNDALGDPLLNGDHVRLLNLGKPEVLAALTAESLKINRVLSTFFDLRNLILVDFKLEFGWDGDALTLGDEISPDTCRLWDKTTLDKLDKDRFRRDLGRVEEAYQEVLSRVMA